MKPASFVTALRPGPARARPRLAGAGNTGRGAGLALPPLIACRARGAGGRALDSALITFLSNAGIAGVVVVLIICGLLIPKPAHDRALEDSARKDAEIKNLREALALEAAFGDLKTEVAQFKPLLQTFEADAKAAVAAAEPGVKTSVEALVEGTSRRCGQDRRDRPRRVISAAGAEPSGQRSSSPSRFGGRTSAVFCVSGLHRDEAAMLTRWPAL